MLAWAYSMRHFEPDFILEENVPGFDSDICGEVCNRGDSKMPKFVCTRPSHGEHRTWAIRHIMVNPCLQLNFPASGRRQYILWALSGFAKHMDDQPSFDDVFKKAAEDSPAVLLQASNDMLDGLLAERVEKSDAIWGADLSSVSWEDTLLPSERKRLQARMKAAHDDGLVEERSFGGSYWSVEAAITCLGQEGVYASTRTEVFHHPLIIHHHHDYHH